MRYIVRPWHAFHSTPMCIMVHLAALPCALGRNSPKAHSICLKPVFNLLACCLCFASLLACACYDRLEPLGGWHQLDSQLHIRQLHLMRQVIRGHQRSSEVIRGHQRVSPTGLATPGQAGHQRSSEVIRGHQRSSEVIRTRNSTSAAPRTAPKALWNSPARKCSLSYGTGAPFTKRRMRSTGMREDVLLS